MLRAGQTWGPVILPVNQKEVSAETPFKTKEKQMRRGKLIAAATAALLACMMSLAGIPAAQASSQLCGNGGSGYCMNAWGGGPYVKMYYGGYYNDDFYLRPVYACSGHATVQSTADGDSTNCPFTIPDIDHLYHKDLIVEVVYGHNGECVGTGSSGGYPDVGYLGSCGNSSGGGAANGVIDVQTDLYCSTGFGLVNRYWTNQDSTYYVDIAYVTSGGSLGANLYVGATSAETCWG